MSFDEEFENIKIRLNRLECSHNYSHNIDDLYQIHMFITTERYGIRCSNCGKIVKRFNDFKLATKKLNIINKQKENKNGK